VKTDKTQDQHAYKAYDELLRKIWAISPDMHSEFGNIGGFRGLFDLHAHEWKMSKIEQKIGFLRQIGRALDWDFVGMMYILRSYWNASGRPDIGHVMSEGMAVILAHAIRLPGEKP